MHAIRAVVGTALMMLTALASAPALAQHKVDVVLQLAGSASTGRDQPYGAYAASVALSPDGRHAVAGDSTGVVRLWNVADGSLLRTFRHSATVSAVAFASDGRRIVTVSKSIRVWDAESGRLIQVVDASLPEITALAMSRDGARLVSAGSDSNVTELEVVSARQLRTYSPDSTAAGPMSVAAYSHDGRFLLTGHQDSTMRLWDTTGGDLVRSFEVTDLTPIAVAFSPDGNRVLALAGGEIRLWDRATGKLVRRTEFSNSATSAVSVLMQGSRVIVCDGNILTVIDAADGKIVRTLDVHTDRVTATAFSRDGKQILLVTESGALRLADAETGRAVRDFNTPYATTLLAAAFSPDGKQLLAGENGKRIQHWDMSAANFVRALEGSEEPMRTLTLSPDASRLLAGDGVTFSLWDMAAGRAIRTFESTDKQLMPAALSPDGRYVLANGPKNGEVTLWDAASGARVRALQGDLSQVLRGIFSPDSQRVATVGFGTPVQLWDAASGKLIRTLSGSDDSSLPIAFSRDGRRLVASGPNMSAGLWDTETGKRLDVPPFPMGENFLLSSDGRRLLSTSTEQTNLIDLTNGQLLLGLPGSIPFETPAVFLPDGQSFLVGGYERVMTHRDVTSGAIIREFAGHSGPVIALAISPDGKRVVTGGPDTTLKLWSVEGGELLATMVGAANGEWIILTPEGFFSASAKGADYLKVVSGFDALPAERFRQLLQRPDLVAEKIAGDPRGAVREAAAKLDLGSAFAAAKRTP